MASRSRRPSQARRRSGSSARGASSSLGGALIAGLAALVLLVVVVGLGGCGDDAKIAGSPGASASAGPSASAAATKKPAKTPKPTPVVDPTAVPGTTDEPTPEPTRPSTTVTDWGEITDGVPVTFPVYPGAEVADAPDGPASAAWVTTASPAKVSGWYVAHLEDQGYSTINLADPLEDGTIVLDSGSDVPECRIQTSFRPVDGSTIIMVLYGSGCSPALD